MVGEDDCVAGRRSGLRFDDGEVSAGDGSFGRCSELRKSELYDIAGRCRVVKLDNKVSFSAEHLAAFRDVIA